VNRSAPDAPPWPLEDGERVLWEGAPDSAAPPSDGIGPIFRTRFLAGFLLLLLAIGLALAAYRLRLSGDTWTLPCADPSLRIELPLETLDGAAFAFCFVGALVGLVFLGAGRARRIRRRTRYAVTDRRVLVAVGRRLRAVSRDAVVRVLREPCVRLAPDPPQEWFGLVVLLRPRRRWQTPERVVLGPLARESGLACEALLLGLDPAEESGETARTLPDWLPDDSRRRLLAALSPGERILWMGRPVFRRFPPELVFLAAVVVAGIVAMAFAEHPSAREALVGFAAAARTLFVRIGCPFGWLFGAILLAMPAGCLVGVVLNVKWFLTAERRREWSRLFFLVTDRRAVSPTVLVAVDPDRLFPPVVKRLGRDRANVYFAARPGSRPPRRPNAFTALGFLDLPPADIPAALAALEELRNSAAPRAAFRP
jgi:hypothetical protein